MDFYDVLKEVEEGLAFNSYAGKIDGEWQRGFISIDFLNKYFSQYSTTEQMINATESESLKLYFAWLRDESILN